VTKCSVPNTLGTVDIEISGRSQRIGGRACIFTNDGDNLSGVLTFTNLVCAEDKNVSLPSRHNPILLYDAPHEFFRH
jgi:hypothetical protein